jgi:hypothetical protein
VVGPQWVAAGLAIGGVLVCVYLAAAWTQLMRVEIIEQPVGGVRPPTAAWPTVVATVALVGLVAAGLAPQTLAIWLR